LGTKLPVRRDAKLRPLSGYSGREMLALRLSHFDRCCGFVEGRNLVVDQRGFSTNYDRFPEIAAALVKSPVDALLCSGEIALRAAQ